MRCPAVVLVGASMLTLAFGGGTALAADVRADFNGDGYDDLAVGNSARTVGAVSSAGGVHVVYGSSSGLRESSAQLLTQSDAAGFSEVNDQFGDAVAAGDLNGDGYADLAVGVPDEDLGSNRNVGVVNVIYGGAGGLASAGARQFTQADAAGLSEVDDMFGLTLVTGDFNGDNRADLASGARENSNIEGSMGAVNIMYGSATGLARAGATQFLQSDAGGLTEPTDYFGFALAAADITGDGHDELVIGTPIESLGPVETGVERAGVINVLLGSPSGLGAVGAQQLTQSDAGGSAERLDQFGRTLTAGDFDGDGHADVAVGVHEFLDGSGFPAGAVNVLYGASTGLDRARARQLTQADGGGVIEPN